MGLIGIGALSGFGGAIKDSAAALQKTVSDNYLAREVEKYEALRQKRAIEAAHTEGEATRDVTMRAAQLQSDTQKATTGMHVEGSKAVAGITTGSAEKIAGWHNSTITGLAQKNDALQRDLQQDRLVTESNIHAADLTSREQMFDKTFGLKERTTKLEEGKVTPLMTAEGQAAMFSPTGKFMGYYAGKDGQPLKFKTDMTEGTKARVTAYIAQQTDISRELRDRALPEDERRPLKQDFEDLTRKIEEATGYAEKTPDKKKTMTLARLQDYAGDKHLDLRAARMALEREGVTILEPPPEQKTVPLDTSSTDPPLSRLPRARLDELRTKNAKSGLTMDDYAKNAAVGRKNGENLTRDDWAYIIGRDDLAGASGGSIPPLDVKKPSLVTPANLRLQSRLGAVTIPKPIAPVGFEAWLTRYADNPRDNGNIEEARYHLYMKYQGGTDPNWMVRAKKEE